MKNQTNVLIYLTRLTRFDVKGLSLLNANSQLQSSPATLKYDKICTNHKEHTSKHSSTTQYAHCTIWML